MKRQNRTGLTIMIVFRPAKVMRAFKMSDHFVGIVDRQFLRKHKLPSFPLVSGLKNDFSCIQKLVKTEKKELNTKCS